MNPLQIIFVLSGIVIFIAGVDAAKKQKFNALHFLIFLGVGVGLLVFTFFPNVLDLVGRIFGVARGADALVYGAIIFLLYFSLLLLNKVEKSREDVTRLIREDAILHAPVYGFLGAPKDGMGFLIRAYNEGTRIGEVIEQIKKSGYTTIVVVNDGSRDSTQEVLDASENVVAIRHAFNRGPGAALETGFEYFRRHGNAMGVEYVVTFDADWQHDIADIENFKDAFKRDPALDAVFGSRFITKTRTNVPLLRRLILIGGRVFTVILSRIRLTDAHNWYRVFRLSAVRKIKLTMDAFEYASELIEEVHKARMRYAEVPVNIHYDDYSLGKWQKNSNALNIVWRMIWKKFFK